MIALPLGRSIPVPTEYEAGWTTEWVRSGHFGDETRFASDRESNRDFFFSCTARKQVICAKMAASRLPKKKNYMKMAPSRLAKKKSARKWRLDQLRSQHSGYFLALSYVYSFCKDSISS